MAASLTAPTAHHRFVSGVGPVTAWVSATLLGYELGQSGTPATPYKAPSTLRITELMYNPAGGGDYEFIELKNAGQQPLVLGSASFEGIEYVFPFDTPALGPGEFLVLARNARRFAERYPGVTITGIYEGHLSNQGEQLVLKSGLGEVLATVVYDDEHDWPLTPDGWGDSLVLVANDSDPNNPKSWRASQTLYGSPGGEGPQTAVMVR